MHSSNIKYIPQVDHLRAMAALWIVLYHGEQLIEAVMRTGSSFVGDWHYSMNPLVSVVREGHTAVALFMVLSGFIFTYGTYGRTVAYGRFMTNRLLRIYPLFLSLVFLSLASTPSAFDLSAFLTTVLPLADIQVLQTGPLTSMAWAVAVEFQFYLIFPFLLVFLNRGTSKFFISVVGCALMFRLLVVGLGANARDISYWHIFGRIDQFAAGMVAAAVLRKYPMNSGPMRMLFFTSAILVVAVLFGFHRLGGWPATEPWKVVWPTLEGGMFAILIASYVTAGSMMPKWISKALCVVGAASFSVYLLHFAIIAIVIRHEMFWRLTGNTSVDAVASTVFIVIPITLAAAAITYRVIEKPFLSMRRTYIVAPPASASVSVVSSSVAARA